MPFEGRVGRGTVRRATINGRAARPNGRCVSKPARLQHPRLGSKASIFQQRVAQRTTTEVDARSNPTWEQAAHTLCPVIQEAAMAGTYDLSFARGFAKCITFCMWLAVP